MEIWKDIIGYEGLYQVSNTGIIRSMDRICKYKNSYRKRKSQIIKPCKKSKWGHSQVSLCKDGIITSLAPHRLVAIAFIPNPNNLPLVCHNDNDPTNNHITNLYWGTYDDNMKQMIRDGRHRSRYS